MSSWLTFAVFCCEIVPLSPQAVGSTPVIMGKKLRTAYYAGKNYMEVDVDISCSAVRACSACGFRRFHSPCFVGVLSIGQLQALRPSLVSFDGAVHLATA